MVNIQEENLKFTEEYVKNTAREFYKTSREYLEQWTEFNKELEIFDSVRLHKTPDWEEVQQVVDALIEFFLLMLRKTQKCWTNIQLFYNM